MATVVACMSASRAVGVTSHGDPITCTTGFWCGGTVSHEVSTGGTADECEAKCQQDSACTASTFYPAVCGSGCPTGACCYLANTSCADPVKSSCPAARLCRVSVPPPPPPPPPPPTTYDLRPFETSVLRQWVAQFELGGPAWNYSFTPINTTTRGCGREGRSLYAPVDVASVWWIVDQLTSTFTADELAAWGRYLDTFQRPIDGSYAYLECETSGFEPWHADATGVIGTRFFRAASDHRTLFAGSIFWPAAISQRGKTFLNRS
jgi:hypothetical protein